MKKRIDWSKLNKMYILIWYIISIIVMCVLYIWTNNILFSFITSHLGYLIFIGTSIIEYMIENRIIIEGKKQGCNNEDMSEV